MPSPRSTAAFSLIEVGVALGICSFVLIALLGLFTVGLHDTKESGEKIDAANLASVIFSARRASPTNDAGVTANLVIPAAALKRPFSDVYGGAEKFVASDGTLTTAAKAAFRVRCSAGTNAVTGATSSMVYLFLSWPPQADPSAPTAKTYEFFSCIPLPQS